MWRLVSQFFRAHLVPTLSLLIALGSFVVVPTTTSTAGVHWWEAIDLKTINLLFCLMFVIAGLRECNLFRAVASRLMRGLLSLRSLAIVLVLFTFFLSMFITNDVALIAMVPFSLYLLDRLQRNSDALYLTVLLTLAANLGSMATPIGNPQNLFLYTEYTIPTMEFFYVMGPITLAGMLLLIALTCFVPKIPLNENVDTNDLPRLTHGRKVIVLMGFFLACLASVVRLIPHEWLFYILFPCGLIWYRKTLQKVDYGLLLTFVAFFIFSHNIGCIPALEAGLKSVLNQAPQTTAIVLSQVLSNVPAAILLSQFTDAWQPLLLGVDIGGFGTLIASLASLISFNFYLKAPGAKPLRYLMVFTLTNLLFLFLLVMLTCVL